MMGWPSRSLIFGAMRRARMSMPPPGGNPIMMRMGRLGKVCAQVERTKRPSETDGAFLKKASAFILRTNAPLLLFGDGGIMVQTGSRSYLPQQNRGARQQKDAGFFRVPNWRIAA